MFLERITRPIERDLDNLPLKDLPLDHSLVLMAAERIRGGSRRESRTETRIESDELRQSYHATLGSLAAKTVNVKVLRDALNGIVKEYGVAFGRSVILSVQTNRNLLFTARGQA